MRNVLLAFLLLMSGCSAPRYSYQFDHYKTEYSGLPYKSLKRDVRDSVAKLSPANRLKVPAEFITADAGSRIYRTSDSDRVLSHSLLLSKHSRKSILKPAHRSTDIKPTDKSRNWFAITGFISVLVGIVGARVLMVLFPFVALLVLLGFGILGIIFGAKGRKSERGVLGDAALILGIAEVAAFLLITTIYFLFFFGIE